MWKNVDSDIWDWYSIADILLGNRRAVQGQIYPYIVGRGNAGDSEGQ